MLEQRSTAAQQHHVNVQHGSLRHCSSVAARKSIFAEHAAQHQNKMASNPFSGGFSGVRPKPLNKNDPGYGKPVAGSKSERRGLAAAARINAEVAVLCDMIHQEGERYDDGTAAITFGDLFQIYTRISNKVVGILLRARKHGFVAFEGEVLFQGRDDNEPVCLLKPIAVIRDELSRDTEFVVGVCHRAKEGDMPAEGGSPDGGTKGTSEAGTDRAAGAAVAEAREAAVGGAGETAVGGEGEAAVRKAGEKAVGEAGEAAVGGAGEAAVGGAGEAAVGGAEDSNESNTKEAPSEGGAGDTG